VSDEQGRHLLTKMKRKERLWHRRAEAAAVAQEEFILAARELHDHDPETHSWREIHKHTDVPTHGQLWRWATGRQSFGPPHPRRLSAAASSTQT
jgi:hypothetical protein